MDIKTRFGLLVCLMGLVVLSGCGFLWPENESSDEAACDPGRTTCGDVCVDISADIQNCGACGNVCGSNADCEDGVCTEREPCQPGECPSGQFCDASSGACRVGCLSDSDCTGDRVCDVEARQCVCDSGQHACRDTMCCQVLDETVRQLTGVEYRSLDLALGPDGRSHMVTQRAESNDVDYLVADTNDGYEAEPVALADTPEAIPGGQTLTVDASGRPHVALLTVDTSELATLQHATPDGDGWSIDRVATTSQGSAIPSIVAPSAGSIALAYRSVGPDFSSFELLYFANDGGGWEGPRLHDDEFLGAPQLAVDREYSVKMAFWDDRTGSLSVVDPLEPNEGPTLNTGTIIRAPSLAFDTDNHPHVVFWDMEYQEVVYAAYDGDEWHTERIGEIRFGADPRLVLDSNDRPHVVYVHEASSEVIYTRRVDDAWRYALVGRTVEGNDISSDRWVDIAITDDDVVVLAYLEWDGAVAEMRLDP